MADNEQPDIAAKAMELKQKGEIQPEYLEHQTATPNEGAITGSNGHEPPMGALDAEGHRPVLERSRKVR